MKQWWTGYKSSLGSGWYSEGRVLEKKSREKSEAGKMFGDIQKLQKNRQRQGKWIRMAVAVALVLTVVLILATGKEEPPVAVAP
ncbi:MAG: hypothetical protein ACD_28C00247G0002, partial [uncultured bacterium]